MSKEYALGVDIGGTNTVFGVVDRQGEIVYEKSVTTNDFSSPEELVSSIHDDLNDQSFFSNIITIGVGAPNGNYFTGNVEYAPNLKWDGIIPLAQLFNSKFDLPAILTNDANAAAVGEKLFGAAQNIEDFVTITLGTGLGSGVIINGQLVYGHDGFAGEYGHIRVVPNGRNCGCGRNGCLETYASATGMIRSIEELDSDNKATSSLSELATPTALDISTAALEGDAFAIEILDFTANVLGNALADFACFSNPKAFVLFGGPANSGKYFIDKIKEEMDKNLLVIYKDKIDIIVSSLQELNAAVLGSAAVAFTEIEK